MAFDGSVPIGFMAVVFLTAAAVPCGGWLSSLEQINFDASAPRRPQGLAKPCIPRGHPVVWNTMRLRGGKPPPPRRDAWDWDLGSRSKKWTPPDGWDASTGVLAVKEKAGGAFERTYERHVEQVGGGFKGKQQLRGKRTMHEVAKALREKAEMMKRTGEGQAAKIQREEEELRSIMGDTYNGTRPPNAHADARKVLRGNMEAWVKASVERAEMNIGLDGTEPMVSKGEGKALSDGAHEGNSTAQYWLGLCLAYKTGGHKSNPRMAAHWLEQAALRGVVKAQWSTGVCYLQGYGVEADNQTALDWFRKAAKGGHSNAAAAAGMMCMEGWHPLPKNVTLGRALLTQAAKLNHVRAQILLAQWHMHCANIQRAYCLNVLRSSSNEENEEDEGESGEARLRDKLVRERGSDDDGGAWIERAREVLRPGAKAKDHSARTGQGVASSSGADAWDGVEQGLEETDAKAIHANRVLAGSTSTINSHTSSRGGNAAQKIGSRHVYTHRDEDYVSGFSDIVDETAAKHNHPHTSRTSYASGDGSDDGKESTSSLFEGDYDPHSSDSVETMWKKFQKREELEKRNQAGQPDDSGAVLRDTGFGLGWGRGRGAERGREFEAYQNIFGQARGRSRDQARDQSGCVQPAEKVRGDESRGQNPDVVKRPQGGGSSDQVSSEQFRSEQMSTEPSDGGAGGRGSRGTGGLLEPLQEQPNLDRPSTGPDRGDRGQPRDVPRDRSPDEARGQDEGSSERDGGNGGSGAEALVGPRMNRVDRGGKHAQNSPTQKLAMSKQRSGRKRTRSPQASSDRGKERVHEGHQQGSQDDSGLKEGNQDVEQDKSSSNQDESGLNEELEDGKEDTDQGPGEGLKQRMVKACLRNEALALKWFRRAAKLGHPWGMVMVAECYVKGIGARQNPQKAEKWIAKIAKESQVDIDHFFEDMVIESPVRISGMKSSWNQWGEESDDDGSAHESSEWSSLENIEASKWLPGYHAMSPAEDDVLGNDYPGVGCVPKVRSGRTLRFGQIGEDHFDVEPPEIEDFDREQFRDFGATREERRERWLEDLERKQYDDIMRSQYEPPEICQDDRGRLVSKDMLQELLYKFKHWDEIVDKRSLLKYEKVRDKGEKAQIRRFAEIGVEGERFSEEPRKPSQIYGYGHGLRGWFGEDVSMHKA